ncbi:MAG: 16S rRNA (cytidine(1402)-2'-O)-methyltransferase [Methylococcales bacterium]
MGLTKGALYIVATPIGNLSDITYRAVEVLKDVDVIAAEDTRHSRRLLQHYGVEKPLVAFHEHNERKVADTLIRRLSAGESIAIISDAGTPLISDPGFSLVRIARKEGIAVKPVPGPCALVAALSVSGLATDHFVFEGFPPRTSMARRTYFGRALEYFGTLIYYEACHRIEACLSDMQIVFPGERHITIARELTKTYETVVSVTLGNVLEVFNDPYMRKGEFVVLLQGREVSDRSEPLKEHEEKLLAALLDECSLKSAVNIATKVHGLRKKTVYDAALRMVEERG